MPILFFILPQVAYFIVALLISGDQYMSTDEIVGYSILSLIVGLVFYVISCKGYYGEISDENMENTFFIAIKFLKYAFLFECTIFIIVGLKIYFQGTISWTLAEVTIISPFYAILEVGVFSLINNTVLRYFLLNNTTATSKESK